MLRLENPGQKKTDMAGKSRPSGLWRETFYIHSLAGKGKARKLRQVTTDTAGKSGCQKLQIAPEILASNYQKIWLILPGPNLKPVFLCRS